MQIKSESYTKMNSIRKIVLNSLCFFLFWLCCANARIFYCVLILCRSNFNNGFFNFFSFQTLPTNIFIAPKKHKKLIAIFISNPYYITHRERGRTAAGSHDLRKVSPPSKHTGACKGRRARVRAVGWQLVQLAACWHRNDTTPCQCYDAVRLRSHGCGWNGETTWVQVGAGIRGSLDRARNDWRLAECRHCKRLSALPVRNNPGYLQ